MLCILLIFKTISHFQSAGKYNKLRIYYLSRLKNKIVKGDEVSHYFNFPHLNCSKELLSKIK